MSGGVGFISVNSVPHPTQALPSGELPAHPNELAALKELKIHDQQAKDRFQAEVEALHVAQHSARLRLISSDIGESWLVSEYLPGGTLAKNPDLFKGKALDALKAFEPLVSAVVALPSAMSFTEILSPQTSISRPMDIWCWVILASCSGLTTRAAA